MAEGYEDNCMIYSDFYRNQLVTPQAVRFYDEIVHQIESGNTSGIYKFDITNRSGASIDVFSAIQMVIADNPQYFFLGRRNKTIINGNQIVLYNSVLYDKVDIIRIQERIEENLQFIYQYTSGDDEINKERKVYNYIVRGVTYVNDGEEANHNITGPILKAKGVCDGYAKYLSLALRKVGIPSIRVTGIGRNQRHCWNMVWVNNTAYHLDASWELVSRDKEQVGSRYFNLTEKEICRDHIIMTKCTPACNNIFSFG